MSLLAHHFGNDSRFAGSEEACRRQWFIKARQDKQVRDDLAEEAAEGFTTVSATVIIANEIQLAEFKEELDVYDAATIEALRQNQLRIDEIKQRLVEAEARVQELLDQAYMMEDGRRVFLSKDGTQAFDENGVEISPDELDFELIGPDRPTWESFTEAQKGRDAAKQDLDQAEAERQAILDYQGKLDEARLRVDSGEMTEQELDEYRLSLQREMPLAVRKQLPDYDPSLENVLKSDFTASSQQPIATASDLVIEPDLVPPPA